MSMAFRILITGSRTWDDISYIRSTFQDLEEEFRDEGSLTLVSGACPTGADALGEVIARELGWQVERHPADWNRHGKRAGFIRNSEMVETLPNILIAFVRNESKGASMTVTIAKKKQIRTVVHSWTDYPSKCYTVKEFNNEESTEMKNDDSQDTEQTLFQKGIVISDFKFPLPCIVCDKALKPLHEGQNYNQPLDGVSFQGQGAYGSEFDCMKHGFLISICDECITEKANKGSVVVSKEQPPIRVEVQYELFDPKEEY